MKHIDKKNIKKSIAQSGDKYRSVTIVAGKDVSLPSDKIYLEETIVSLKSVIVVLLLCCRFMLSLLCCRFIVTPLRLSALQNIQILNAQF